MFLQFETIGNFGLELLFLSNLQINPKEPAVNPRVTKKINSNKSLLLVGIEFRATAIF